MATKVRAKISEKNKYWIDKHRHYELKHFCLQYPRWKKAYADLNDLSISLSNLERNSSTNLPGDPTSKCVMQRAYYLELIDLVETAAMDADEYLYGYILKAVTEGLSYTYLKTRLDIPCGRDMFYDRYRKFFWLLSETRK
ncbi:MAG: hypothetical protein J6B01_04595 [Ruminococcus sp.]|nr:hypothetical protein [Ruminococcus sp.]